MRLLTAVESVLQLERDARAASSYEGSLLSSEQLVYRSRVCRLTRECRIERLTGAILHVHLVKGPSRWFGKRVLEVKSAFCLSHGNQANQIASRAAEPVDNTRGIAAQQ